MLVPVQTAGEKPPLFMIHGIYGTMPIGPGLAKVLGPEQTIYALFADGFDGRRKRNTTITEMVGSYVSQIVGACPDGRLVVGGMCGGGLVTVEVARKLRAIGRDIGPLILLDPPPFPRRHRADIRRPGVARQLYDQARREHLDHADTFGLPIDVRDPRQAHAATLAGVASMLVISHFFPTPFDWRVELVLSSSMARRYLHQPGAYRGYLVRLRKFHMLHGHHLGLFRHQLGEIARLVGLFLQNAFVPEAVDPEPIEATGA